MITELKKLSPTEITRPIGSETILSQSAFGTAVVLENGQVVSPNW